MEEYQRLGIDELASDPDFIKFLYDYESSFQKLLIVLAKVGWSKCYKPANQLANLERFDPAEEHIYFAPGFSKKTEDMVFNRDYFYEPERLKTFLKSKLFSFKHEMKKVPVVPFQFPLAQEGDFYDIDKSSESSGEMIIKPFISKPATPPKRKRKVEKVSPSSLPDAIPQKKSRRDIPPEDFKDPGIAEDLKKIQKQIHDGKLDLTGKFTDFWNILKRVNNDWRKFYELQHQGKQVISLSDDEWENQSFETADRHSCFTHVQGLNVHNIDQYTEDYHYFKGSRALLMFIVHQIYLYAREFPDLYHYVQSYGNLQQLEMDWHERMRAREEAKRAEAEAAAALAKEHSEKSVAEPAVQASKTTATTTAAKSNTPAAVVKAAGKKGTGKGTKKEKDRFDSGSDFLGGYFGEYWAESPPSPLILTSHNDHLSVVEPFSSSNCNSSTANNSMHGITEINVEGTKLRLDFSNPTRFWTSLCMSDNAWSLHRSKPTTPGDDASVITIYTKNDAISTTNYTQYRFNVDYFLNEQSVMEYWRRQVDRIKNITTNGPAGRNTAAGLKATSSTATFSEPCSQISTISVPAGPRERHTASKQMPQHALATGEHVAPTTTAATKASQFVPIQSNTNLAAQLAATGKTAATVPSSNDLLGYPYNLSQESNGSSGSINGATGTHKSDPGSNQGATTTNVGPDVRNLEDGIKAAQQMVITRAGNRMEHPDVMSRGWMTGFCKQLAHAMEEYGIRLNMIEDRLGITAEEVKATWNAHCQERGLTSVTTSGTATPVSNNTPTAPPTATSVSAAGAAATTTGKAPSSAASSSKQSSPKHGKK